MNLQILFDEIEGRLYDVEQAKKQQRTCFNNRETDWRYYERNEYHAWNFIRDICKICEVDEQRTIIIVRSMRKWSKKCKWQFCLNVKAHEQAILKFIKADV